MKRGRNSNAEVSLAGIAVASERAAREVTQQYEALKIAVRKLVTLVDETILHDNDNVCGSELCAANDKVRGLL